MYAVSAFLNIAAYLEGILKNRIIVIIISAKGLTDLGEIWHGYIFRSSRSAQQIKFCDFTNSI